MFPLACHFYQSIWDQGLLSMDSNGVESDLLFTDVDDLELVNGVSTQS
jgi:hypothetical protein